MTARHITDRNLAIARVVEEVAAAKDCSMTQVAINWVRQQDQQINVRFGVQFFAAIAAHGHQGKVVGHGS